MVVFELSLACHKEAVRALPDSQIGWLRGAARDLPDSLVGCQKWAVRALPDFSAATMGDAPKPKMASGLHFRAPKQLGLASGGCYELFGIKKVEIGLLVAVFHFGKVAPVLKRGRL